MWIQRLVESHRLGMFACQSQVEHFDEKAPLVTALREDLREGDLVLVKGSRGVQMETVVSALRTDRLDEAHA